jgi:hypothetical protein
MMLDESTLRKLAAWEQPSQFDEEDCVLAVGKFVALIDQCPDLATIKGDYSYNNYVPVYVYAPADVERSFSANGHKTFAYPCLLLYFHHFLPIVAVGVSSWVETSRANGTNSSRSFGGLDLGDLITLSSDNLERRMARTYAALKSTGYAAQAPEYLTQPAPDSFEPLQRSEGAQPWDRVFHLLFQFND